MIRRGNTFFMEFLTNQILSKSIFYFITSLDVINLSINIKKREQRGIIGKGFISLNVEQYFILLPFQNRLCILFIADQWHLAKCKSCWSGFGGLGVACWPLVPKFAGSNPAEAVGFLRAKKSSARLPSEGK